MRTFQVWARVDQSTVIVTMPDNATDDECEEACADALDSLVGQGDTGWNELDVHAATPPKDGG